MLSHRSFLAAATLLLSLSARAETADGSFTSREPDAVPASSAGIDHGKVATDDATPAGAGALEVELAYGPSLTHEGTGDFDRVAHAHAHAFTLGVLYGLTDQLDVKVGTGFGYVMDRSDVMGPTRGSGMTDLVLGSRWRFLALADRALDVMLTTTAVAPTGLEQTTTSLGLTQGFWSLRNALVASKDWGRATSNVELALTLPVGGGAGSFRGLGCANLALGYALLSWLQPLVEANYDHGWDSTTQQRLALTAGVNLTGQRTRVIVGVQQAVWGRNVAQTTNGLVAVKAAF
jgi:hypothetical protein